MGKKKSPLFASPATTKCAKLPWRRCSFCARETAYGTKQFPFSTLGKKVSYHGLTRGSIYSPQKWQLEDDGL